MKHSKRRGSHSNEPIPKGEESVRAKKHLGQHFLRDEHIAERIASSLSLEGYRNILEIGPGMGVLTKYLLRHPARLFALDIDKESIAYLNSRFQREQEEWIGKSPGFQVIEADFLKADLSEWLGQVPFAITGNFPYNISSQILFRALERKAQIPEFSGMFQREVARRICSAPGSKEYGILSVLVQAFYRAEYLFTVHPEVFSPPPRVQSGVLHLQRIGDGSLDCDERLFFRVVKTAFNQRRKTLRNSLKALEISQGLAEDSIFDRRPEQLSVADFVAITQRIAHDSV